MDESWVLLDANTGLHQAWYFWLRVLDEVNRSTRYGTPFALLLLEADAPSKAATDASSYVPAAIRSTDLGGALASGRAGVLLTHQHAAAAEQARDRVLRRLAEACPEGLEWRSTLYCYPEHAAEISDLLTSRGGREAGDGLTRAQRSA